MKLRQIVIAQINTILDRRALKEIFPTLLFFGCRCKQVIFKFFFIFTTQIHLVNVQRQWTEILIIKVFTYIFFMTNGLSPSFLLR